MEKIRSLGIIIFSILFMLKGILIIGGTLLHSCLILMGIGIGNLAYSKISGFLSMVIGFCCAIGTLRLKEWGRKLALFYAFLSVILYLTSVLISYKPIKSFSEELFSVPFSTMGFLPSLILVFIFSGIILVFFTRPKVKEQFK